MTRLRKMMLDKLQRRNYAQNTLRTYISAVEEFAAYFRKRPDHLGPEHIRAYQVHLFRDRKLSSGTVEQRRAAARTGAPFTVTTTGGITNAGGADRPNRVAEGPLSSSQRSIDRWFDLAAFQVQPQYTYGNSGRNILFGPGLRNIDVSLSKTFLLTEHFRLQFRAESFNATNTPAFGQPSAVLNANGAGTISSAGDPRRMQFGLKLLW